MLFAEGASAVVRLCDSLKLALVLLEQLTREAVQWAESNRDSIDAMKRDAMKRDAMQRQRQPGQDDEVEDAGSNVDPALAIAQQGMFRQSRIHSQSLTTVLLSCFLMESYINSLAHFLLAEHDLLGLIRDGRKSSADVMYEAVERMSVREKWGAVPRLFNDAKFDKSRRPWQDFDILFRFRDDHVHDKVLEYSELDDRYGGRLPNKIGGHLTLTHAVLAAETYWAMVTALHDLLDVPMSEFHRHYDLSPWLTNVGEARKLAQRFENLF